MKLMGKGDKIKVKNDPDDLTYVVRDINQFGEILIEGRYSTVWVDSTNLIPDQENNPTPGQIYWHEYRVVCVVLPGPGFEDSPRYFTAEHAGTGNWHDIIPAAGSPTAKAGDARNWAWPALPQAHVCYQSTRDDSGKCWLRPLDEFTDGRFTLLSSPDAELYQ